MMMVKKQVSVEVGTGSPSEIIRAMEESRLEEKAKLVRCYSSGFEILSESGWISETPSAYLVFEWWDEE